MSSEESSMLPPDRPQIQIQPQPTSVGVFSKVVVLTALSFPLAAFPAIVYLGRRSRSLTTLTGRLNQSIGTLERDLVACRRQQQQLLTSVEGITAKLEQIQQQGQLERRRGNKTNTIQSESVAELAGLIEELHRGLGMETPDNVKAVERLRKAAMGMQNHNE